MPTYNNIQYNSLPQQVEANRVNNLEIQEYLEEFGVKVFSTSEDLEDLTWISSTSLELLSRTPVVGDYVLGADGFAGNITNISGEVIVFTTPIDMRIQGPIGVQGEIGPQGEQGVQGSTGPAGPDGTPVEGIEIVALADAVLGGYSITINDQLNLAPSRFDIDAELTSGTIYLSLYIDGILDADKISVLDTIFIRNDATDIRMFYYDETGEKTEYYAQGGSTSEVKIHNLGPFTLYQSLNGSTVGPTGPAGTQGIQGVQGPTGAQGVQGVQGEQGEPGTAEEPGTDDLRFPLTRNAQGQTLKPDYNFVDMGLEFPENDPDEIAYIICQMPHDREPNSEIWPHVHCRLEEDEQPNMYIDYKWFNPTGAAIPSTWTTYEMNGNTATWTSGETSNMIYGSSPIDGTGFLSSSIMLIKLYRDSDSYSGDLLVHEFDIHYTRSRFGDDS